MSWFQGFKNSTFGSLFPGVAAPSGEGKRLDLVPPTAFPGGVGRFRSAAQVGRGAQRTHPVP
ncbi:hypothetical protein DXA95_11775 [Odoribacter sp. OF09-27XD]|nr:hypothetical protein DXA95_11775 [Odoribacter sp. OF09-27XD]